jgi:uncharacterized protein YbjT (DUF2867 family)
LKQSTFLATDSYINRTVLLAGATGLVGRECLRLLVDDEKVEEVRALVRRPLHLDKANPRVRECMTDFNLLHAHPDWFQVDWVFCALGTTMRNAGSREAFRQVDYEYPLTIARIALAHGATHLLLVSAMGADSGSDAFYYRVKGELEDAVRTLGYQSVTIARPSLLLGERAEWRLGEEVAKRLMWLLPPRWHPVHASQVASSLVRAAHAPVFGVRILENTVLRTAV